MLLVGCWWSHCPCPRQCRVPSLGSDRFCQPSPSLFLVLISSWWGALTHTPCPISCPPLAQQQNKRRGFDLNVGAVSKSQAR